MPTKGYVYILTNPSFQRNWIKIGMTSHDVEIRAKELDTTGVPLPFEVYAKMETAHYEKAEKLIHKMIDRFTDKRVRKSREFFNIEPIQAYEIFQDVADLLDDANVVMMKKVDQREKSEKREKTSVEEMWVQYWDAFNDYVKVHAPDLHVEKHGRYPQNWHDVMIGTRNCHVVMGASVMHKRVKIGVWAHDSQIVMDAFEKNKGMIEKVLGSEMELTRGKNLSLYAFENIDVNDRKNWDRAFDWYVKKFPMLRDAMKDVVK